MKIQVSAFQKYISRKSTQSVIAFLFILLFHPTFAQQATIKGVVTDKESGEGLFGATVGISSIGKGGSCDFEGGYTINSIPPGVYKVQCQYISYKTETIEEFEVKAGQTYTLNFQMGEESTDLGGVDVIIKLEENTENALLLIQKRETAVMDAVSSETFSKVGAFDAASAAEKVSGVTVQGGKYVYVRGLGDRYSKTLVNGAEIPGLDPNKNSVQMDLFPTSLLNNLLIFKTYQADKPGDYSGGLIDITTRQSPDKFQLSVTTGFGYNPNAHFNSSFLTYDNSVHTLPAQLAGKSSLPTSNDGKNNETIAREVISNTQSFDNKMDFGHQSNPINSSQSITIGSSVHLNDTVKIGFTTTTTYQKKYTAHYNAVNARWQLSESADKHPVLNNQRFFNDTRGMEEDVLGWLLNAGITSGEKFNIGFNLLHNFQKEKDARFLHGWYPQNDPNLYYYTRSLQNNFNRLTIGQLVGEYRGKNTIVSGVSSCSISGQEQPDLRFFTYGDYIEGTDTLSKVDISIGQLPTRYFRNMKQTNWDNKIHLAQTLSEKSELKGGLSGTFIHRSFREEQFRYANDRLVFNNTIEDHLNNVWAYGKNNGVYIISAFDLRNNYDANQTVLAGYLQYKYQPNKISTFIGGVRAEKATIDLVSFDSEAGEAHLNNLDFLPSLTYIYQVSEDVKFKSALTRSLARPTFRELAPFGSFQFVGQELLVGNPKLQRTLIDNFDIRFEKYSKVGELMAISLFGKRFTNPIERIINPFATNEINFTNIDYALLSGAEFEWRKQIDKFTDSSQVLRVGINSSLIYSRINLTSEVYTSVSALDPNAKSFRPMFGQAPYTLNGIISYEHYDKRIRANINLNVSGPKMFLVMKGATPNVFEKSRADLGCNVSKEFGIHWNLKLSVSNLLNTAYRYEQDFGGVSYTFSNYRSGRTFGLGITYRLD